MHFSCLLFAHKTSCPNCFLLFRVPLPNLIGRKGEKALVEFGFEKQMVSMGHQASGALELWNYPTWLRDLVPQDINGQDRPDHVDLPALEGSTS
jgi:alpha-dioxygenase